MACRARIPCTFDAALGARRTASASSAGRSTSGLANRNPIAMVIAVWWLRSSTRLAAAKTATGITTPPRTSLTRRQRGSARLSSCRLPLSSRRFKV